MEFLEGFQRHSTEFLEGVATLVPARFADQFRVHRKPPSAAHRKSDAPLESLDPLVTLLEAATALSASFLVRTSYTPLLRLQLPSLPSLQASSFVRFYLIHIVPLALSFHEPGNTLMRPATCICLPAQTSIIHEITRPTPTPTSAQAWSRATKKL